MSDPTVSAIIPYFNAEETLARAIDSLLKQSYPIIEIILIDNNSTDTSPEIAVEYSQKHPGMFLLLSEEKQNANAARNKGLSVATGEWLQFLDADDEILPDKIKNQIEFANNHQDADIIVSPYTRYYYDKNTQSWQILIHRQINENIIIGLLNCHLGCTISNLWRRKALFDVSGWDNNITSGQEYRLLIKLINTNKKLYFLNMDNSIAYATSNSITRPKYSAKNLILLSNQLNYFSAISQLFVNKQLSSPQISNKIEDFKYSNFIHSYFKNFEFRKEILSIGKGHGLKLNFLYKLKMYPHVIYSKYAFNTKHKYLNFIWYSIRNIYMLFY